MTCGKFENARGVEEFCPELEFLVLRELLIESDKLWVACISGH